MYKSGIILDTHHAESSLYPWFGVMCILEGNARYLILRLNKKSPVSGLHSRRIRRACQHFYFYFFLLHVCDIPIATKIAESIGIHPCCV